VAVKRQLVTVLAAGALAAAGCGGSDDSESAPSPTPAGGHAQQLFTSNCGSCHTLAAAGASGKVGPDLDQLQPGPDLVRTQTENGGAGMPAFKGRLSPEEIDEIATYVAENAGSS